MTTQGLPISIEARPAPIPALRPRPMSTVARTVAHVPELAEGGRRLLNVVVAAIALIAMAPVMGLIAIAVKLSSVGPVGFVQVRIGIDRRRRESGTTGGTRRADLGGAPFRMLKFRTMCVQQDDPQRWATEGDVRVTRVGRVLRQFRIDELPQFVNVLLGDMNVVGPRPEQPLIFAHLRERIARYARRQRVRPGITGLAQVNLAYDRNEDDARRKLTLDLEYIGRQGFTEDLRILLRTLPVMLGRRGGL